MIDRQSNNPGRVKITLDDGSVMYGTIERADDPVVVGTPLNKNTFFNNRNSERYICDLPSEAFELLLQEIVVNALADKWSSSVNENGYYTQTISVAEMKKEYTPVYALEYDKAETVNELQDTFAYITRIITADGLVTLCAIERPAIDLSIRLKGV